MDANGLCSKHRQYDAELGVAPPDSLQPISAPAPNTLLEQPGTLLGSLSPLWITNPLGLEVFHGRVQAPQN